MQGFAISIFFRGYLLEIAPKLIGQHVFLFHLVPVETQSFFVHVCPLLVPGQAMASEYF